MDMEKREEKNSNITMKYRLAKEVETKIFSKSKNRWKNFVHEI